MKLKGRYFETIEVIELLNSLRKQDIKDAFKKIAEVLGTVHTCGRALLRRL
jgi:hypothetical protein